MIIFRPITLKDYPQVKKLVCSMKTELASLPQDEKLLKQQVNRSIRSFQKKVDSPQLEYYLFGLFNHHGDELIGLSGLYAKSGWSKTFMAFKQDQETFSYPAENYKKQVPIITPIKIDNLFSEACSLYLDTKQRGKGYGKTLSYTRYLFIKSFPERFHNQMVSTVRGYRNTKGASPFWQATGEVFFNHTLEEIDTLKSMGKKAIIEKLVPRHPIYIPLLPQDARKSIGKVHTKSERAERILESMNFKHSSWIDLLDGGPVLTCKTKSIKPIQESLRFKVAQIVKAGSLKNAHSAIISNCQLKFRATLQPYNHIKSNQIALDELTAKILNVKSNDFVNIMHL